MKWLESKFELSNCVGLVTIFLLVTLVVLLYLAAFFPNCPDSPEPVVDTVYVDSLDWLVSRPELVDSIYVLNEAVDSLEQHIEWLWNTREAVRNDLCIHAGHDMDDPCAGTVSIAAVDSLLGLYRKVESYTTRFGAWTLRLPDDKAKYEFSEYAICDTTYHFEPDLWGRWQRLKDRGQ